MCSREVHGPGKAHVETEEMVGSPGCLRREVGMLPTEIINGSLRSVPTKKCISNTTPKGATI